MDRTNNYKCLKAKWPSGLLFTVGIVCLLITGGMVQDGLLNRDDGITTFLVVAGTACMIFGFCLFCIARNLPADVRLRNPHAFMNEARPQEPDTWLGGRIYRWLKESATRVEPAREIEVSAERWAATVPRVADGVQEIAPLDVEQLPSSSDSVLNRSPDPRSKKKVSKKRKDSGTDDPSTYSIDEPAKELLQASNVKFRSGDDVNVSNTTPVRRSRRIRKMNASS